MGNKSWEEIVSKIENIDLKEDFDLIVAIGRGGIIPGLIISKIKKLDFGILWLRYRNENKKIIFKEPKFLRKSDFESKNKKVLLVDEVSRTGETMKKAKNILKDSEIVKTFVINGEADYSLYNQNCFKFPWD